MPEPGAAWRVAININQTPASQFRPGGDRENGLSMLKHADEMQEVDRPEIRQLLEQLSADGRGWAEAELALARAELRELKAQAIKALTFAILGLAAVFCALVVLSQAAIQFLTPHVGGPGVAALTAGGGLLVLVVVFFLAARSAFSWRTESIFFGWFDRHPSGGAGP